MKKQLRNLIPQTLGACVLASAATSQASFWDATSWYVVPSVGYHYTDEMDHYDKLQKKSDTYKKFEFDDGPVYGIGFGFQTTAYTAVEFAYNYSNFDIVGKPVTGDENKVETSWHYVHVDALYYFNDVYENNFSFYIPVGLGYLKNEPDSSTEDKEFGIKGLEDTVFNFGIGAQWMFSEHVGVRGDIRGLYGFSQENFDAIAQVGLVVRWGMPMPMNVADAPPQSANLQFKLNSTELVNPNDPEIAVLVDTLKNNPDSKVKILAYSDRSGSSEYNMKLSERRAESLKNILITRFDISEDRIYTKAFGDQEGLSRARHAIAIVEH